MMLKRCCWGDDVVGGDDDVEKMLLERKKVSERRVFVDSMSSSEKMKFAGKDGDLGDVFWGWMKETDLEEGG
ncbi:hypothetical protein Tco_0325618 [Tanacetum coccineum]